jgi:hypothetical protein
MQALALYRPSFARLLVRHPMLWVTSAALGASTAMFAGVLVALVVLGGALGTVCAAARTQRLRGWLDRSARRASHRAQRDDRETRLEKAGVPKQGLAAVTLLLDQIIATDPALAAHLELEALLDRYVELEVAAKRYEYLLAESQARPVPQTSPIRMLIRERSTAVHRSCEARLAAAQDELASIFEFLQLLIQRSALESTDPQGDPLEQRMLLLLAADADSDASPG